MEEIEESLKSQKKLAKHLKYRNLRIETLPGFMENLITRKGIDEEEKIKFVDEFLIHFLKLPEKERKSLEPYSVVFQYGKYVGCFPPNDFGYGLEVLPGFPLKSFRIGDLSYENYVRGRF